MRRSLGLNQGQSIVDYTRIRIAMTCFITMLEFGGYGFLAVWYGWPVIAALLIGYAAGFSRHCIRELIG